MYAKYRSVEKISVGYLISSDLTLKNKLYIYIYIVTATSIEALARHNTYATCTIELSMDPDIKMRNRRWWKKGHVYIHSAKL